jgi:hypothetical protein
MKIIVLLFSSLILCTAIAEETSKQQNTNQHYLTQQPKGDTTKNVASSVKEDLVESPDSIGHQNGESTDTISGIIELMPSLIAIISIIGTIIVANNKNKFMLKQVITNNISNARIKLIEALIQLTVEFIQESSELRYLIKQYEQGKCEELIKEGRKRRNSIEAAGSKIYLLLSKTDSDHIELANLLKGYPEDINNIFQSEKNIKELNDRIIEKANTIIKKEWEKAKSDTRNASGRFTNQERNLR